MDTIISQDQIGTLLEKIPSNMRIVLVGGCFDIIHKGHVEFLNAAKKLGDTLVILLESDATVRKLKGEKRPINSQTDRALVLAHLSMIDFIILLDPHLQDSDYSKLVNLLKPDIIAVTKGDEAVSKKRQHAHQVGAKVVEVLERRAGYSTTDILKKRT